MELKSMKWNAIVIIKAVLIVVFYTGTIALLMGEVTSAALGGA